MRGRKKGSKDKTKRIRRTKEQMKNSQVAEAVVENKTTETVGA